MKYKKILVIPDLHCPFMHRDAPPFIKAIVKKYKPDKVVLTGDEVDYHNMSYHDSDPDSGFSASSELEAAIRQLSLIYEIVPNATVLESNHGSMVYRKAKTHGIARRHFRAYADVLETPGWNWVPELVLTMSNGSKVFMCHNLSANALTNSLHKSMCFVQGHYHSKMEVMYWGNGEGLYWGLTAGCLVDQDRFAFSYAKLFPKKFLLGATVIDNGVPQLIPMLLNKRGRWIGKI